MLEWLWEGGFGSSISVRVLFLPLLQSGGCACQVSLGHAALPRVV